MLTGNRAGTASGACLPDGGGVDHAMIHHDLGERATELRAVHGMVQTEVDTGWDIPTRVAQVMSLTAVDDDVDGVSAVDKQGDGVGELQLPTGAGGDAAQRVEDGT